VHSKLVARLSVLLTVALLASRGATAAQDGPSTYDNIWRLAEWYVNDDNDVVQSVLFTGRFQYDYAAVRDDDVTYDEWNVRRMRVGLRSELFRHLTLHGEMELNPQERDPFYMRLTDLYALWRFAPQLALTLGKQSVPFTMDGSTSSKELLTIDRSNLANNLWFPQEYMPGVSFSGTADGWQYRLGAYSAGEANREFGELNAGFFTLAVLGYDVSEALGTDEALIRVNWVYQDPDPGNTFTRQLEHVGSLNVTLADGRWGVRSDIAGGKGYEGQSDLWGTMLMPYVDVTPAFQLVARHTYLKSSDVNGVRLARYESQHTSGRGDRYSELYLGASYYFYGHKLKLQGGVQFADMRDEASDGGAYSGVAGTMGLRLSW
jgi:phosphate-selective porin OprO/OprP